MKSDAEDYRYFPEPDLVPLAPSREWVEELRATPARDAGRPRVADCRRTGATPTPEMRDVVNAGAVELIEATIAAGATPAGRTQVVDGRARPDREHRGHRPRRPAGDPRTGRSSCRRLVDSGRLNDKLARQVLAGVLAGEGSPEEITTARGLGIVSDDGALTAAVDEALAAQPDIAEKIRAGNLGPIGAVIGAVMKATRGQADAGRVRELVLERVKD